MMSLHLSQPFRNIQRNVRWLACSRDYDLKPLDVLVESKKLAAENLYKANDYEVTNSRFFCSERIANDIQLSSFFTSPKISTFVVKDVEVMGWTDFVIKDGVAYHPNDAQPRNDAFVAELEGRAVFDKKAGLRMLARSKVLRSEQAVSLLGQSSTNYAHWVSEVLPKLVLIKDRIDPSQYDVLIDWHLHENLISSMASLGMQWRTIKFVKPFQKVKVGTLLYISPGAYTPADSRHRFERGKFPPPQNRSTFSPELLSLVREEYRKDSGLFDDAKRIRQVIAQQELKSRETYHHSFEIAGQRKRLRLIGRARAGELQLPQGTHICCNPKRLMFLRSHSSHNGRHCENLSAIIPLLEDYGFCKVTVDTMSFDEQVALMEGVECVVSLMGASLANLTFAPAGTKVIILSPFYENADYSYFRHFMAALKHETAFVIGQQIPSRDRTQLTANYKVDLTHLQNALRSLLSEKNQDM